jgi:GNAT superfamily N-acetyltransferase
MADAAASDPEYATTPSGWDSLGYANFGRFLREVGGSSDRHALLERPGVVAAIASGSPERSLFNSVLYEHPLALEEHYEEIGAAYERAGVRAWCVWTPETDRATARFLAGRGHALDGLPRMMSIDLDEVPDAEPALEVEEGFDWETVCLINDAAYGYATGTHAAGLGPGCGAALRAYGVRWRGFDAAVVATLDHESDCGVYLVATLPEARGNGLCGALMRKLLRDARERGCRTSTLQASPAGAPVYARLGYRDLGGIEFRERRAPA